MKTFYSKNKLIKKKKEKLERELKVKININEKITIKGEPLEEHIAEEVIDAIDFGFPIKTALLIKKEDFLFEKINIKDYTKRKDFERIRGRIIGKKGKALRVLHELTKCFLELKGNEVGIIGPPENIQNAQNAIISIIRGAKHSNVYLSLEKHQIKPIFDLGLKNKK